MNQFFSQLKNHLYCVAIAGCLSPQSLFGQVELNRFYPPAVMRGSTTAIKADGKFPQWPVKVECDSAEVSITCGEKAGEFQVVAAESALGVAWIRTYDDQSASGLVPLLIEPATVVVETEPNEVMAKATAVAMPATIVGKLEKSGDVDMWKLSIRRGQVLIASVTANSLLRSPMDCVLQLVDPRGLVVAQAEDDNGLDPQLVFIAASDSELYLRIFCFPETPTGTIGFAGGANFDYVLRFTTGAFIDHTFPLRSIPAEVLKPTAFGWNLPENIALELKPATAVSPRLQYSKDVYGWQWLPNVQTAGWSLGDDEQVNAPEKSFELPLLYYGHIRNVREVDLVKVRVRAKTKYQAAITSRDFGFKLDSVLRVLQPDTLAQIARNDDEGKRSYDASVEFQADQDGELLIEVSDLADSGGLRHAYELQVSAVEPSVNLSVAADHFRVGIGKSLEVSIAVERKSGFDRRLQVSATGLPAGVTAEPVISEPKGDSVKSVKMKINAAANAAAFQGPIEISAVTIDENKQPSGTVLPVQYSLRPQISLEKIWLSIAPDKS